jgi:hypothetical protein
MSEIGKMRNSKVFQPRQITGYFGLILFRHLKKIDDSSQKKLAVEATNYES